MRKNNHGNVGFRRKGNPCSSESTANTFMPTRSEGDTIFSFAEDVLGGRKMVVGSWKEEHCYGDDPRKKGKEEAAVAAAVLWKCVLYLGRASDGHPKVPLLLLPKPSIHSAIKK